MVKDSGGGSQNGIPKEGLKAAVKIAQGVLQCVWTIHGQYFHTISPVNPAGFWRKPAFAP
jgi:hypothetical protein